MTLERHKMEKVHNLDTSEWGFLHVEQEALGCERHCNMAPGFTQS